MRTAGCVLAVAALLGPAPVAMAADSAPSEAVSAETARSEAAQVLPAPDGRQAQGARRATAPEEEVSLLAVTLTAGGALAAAGSGVALALTRRRSVSRQPSRESG